MESSDSNEIIISSSLRSGSTWLGRMLQTHPQLSVHKDDTKLFYLLYPHKTLNPFWDDDVNKGYRPGNLLNIFRSHLVTAYYSRSPAGQKRVLIAPTNTQFLSLLVQAYPHAKHVHLHRYPLDTIASFSQFLENRSHLNPQFGKAVKKSPFLGIAFVFSHCYHKWRWLRFPYAGYLGARPEGFQQAKKYSRLEFLCWYYAQVNCQIQNMLSTIPEHRKSTVSYEDLVFRYEDTMASLLEFMGVDVLKNHLDETKKKVRTTAVGRYKSFLSEDEVPSTKALLRSHGLGNIDVIHNGL